MRRGGWAISSEVASDALARMEERMASLAEEEDWVPSRSWFGSTARPLWVLNGVCAHDGIFSGYYRCGDFGSVWVV